MEFIIFAGGVFVGAIVSKLLRDYEKIDGIIEVDHVNMLCKVNLSSDELANHKNKKVVCLIKHDAHISREEQRL